MSISVSVEPLSDHWMWLDAERLAIYSDVTHLVFPGQNFDYNGWEKILLRLPPLAEFRDASTDAGKTIALTAERAFRNSLSKKLGRPVSWSENVTTVEGEAGKHGLGEECPPSVFEDLDPEGMSALLRLAARYPKCNLETLEKDLSDSRSAVEDSLVQHAARNPESPCVNLLQIDINNILLPIEMAQPLVGLPFRIGSSKALLLELDQLAHTLGFGSHSWANDEPWHEILGDRWFGLGHNMGVLARASHSSIVLNVPMFIDG